MILEIPVLAKQEDRIRELYNISEVAGISLFLTACVRIICIFSIRTLDLSFNKNPTFKMTRERFSLIGLERAVYRFRLESSFRQVPS